MDLKTNLNDYMLIIDGSSLLATSYYGILPNALKNTKLSEKDAETHYSEILQTSDGLYTNAIYGFMNTLLSVLYHQKPKYIVVNWDMGRATFRQAMFKDYKGNRGATPTPLIQQQETIRKLLTFIGIKQFMSENYEADDFSGSLARLYENETYIRILTKDRDHLQLIDDKVNVWLTFPIDKDGNSKQVETLNARFNIDASTLNVPANVFRVTRNLVKPYYGAKPEQISDLKGLMGDTADNIPGVKGIGEKTASILIERLFSIDGIYNYLAVNDDEYILEDFKDWGIKNGNKVLTNLRAVSNTELVGEKAAKKSRDLAKIFTNINFGNLPISVFEQNVDERKLIATLKRLEFNKLLDIYYHNA